MTSRNPLWRFAVDLYGRPGVSEACLTMQSEAHVDVVNLIVVVYADLILLRPLSVVELMQLHKVTAAWRADVVLPLRAIRTALKYSPVEFLIEKEMLRERVKVDELKAEQLQILLADKWLQSRHPIAGLCLHGALLAFLRLHEYRESNAERIHIALAVVVEAANALAAQAVSGLIGQSD